MSGNNAAGRHAAAQLRLLRLLAHGPAAVPLSSVGEGMVSLCGAGGRALSLSQVILSNAERVGLIERRDGRITATSAGVSWLRRRLTAGEDAFPAQHGERETVHLGADRAPIRRNTAESPLSGLHRLKDRGGRPYLSNDAFEAGERLRRDFERGQLQPRITANWEASVASGARSGNGVADLSDAALAARLRVERAVDAVGPELSGVLVDACCFLKGLETIERERQWPVRSAKLMLRTALDVLARHYAPPAEPPRRRNHRWGAAGYRPDLSSGVE